MHSGREWFWADYAASVREVLAAGPDVLDVGTPVPYRKELARIAPNGPAPRIWTLDVPEVGSNEVSVFGDAATLPFRSECFDGAICKEVLEHVREPFLTASELQRVLRPGGRFFVTMIYIHPYHPGQCGDYWRFTQDAVERLFPDAELRIKRAGGWAFIGRSYVRGRLHKALMTGPGTEALNLVDRVLPSGNATLMHYVLGTKRA